jgi:ssDNA-binding Zn-finger/Zn-ribbon topoisomerase 1
MYPVVVDRAGRAWINMSSQVIQTKPEPYCPDCGSKMKLRRPNHPGQRFDPFWGCTQYPDCKGKRNILPNGKPEEDEENL